MKLPSAVPVRTAAVKWTGLGAVAQNNEARSVLATLWSVADATTVVLMQRFYALREQQHLTKAEALRQVQLAFLDGSVNQASLMGLQSAFAPETTTSTSLPWRATSTAPYSHPFFWAPFILIGNWL